MKAAVIYWSGTGNTEQMANAIAEGAGAELFSVSDFTGDIADYDRIAFGCSAMGDEVLEESEFEPFFTAIEGALSAVPSHPLSCEEYFLSAVVLASHREGTARRYIPAPGDQITGSAFF